MLTPLRKLVAVSLLLLALWPQPHRVSEPPLVVEYGSPEVRWDELATRKQQVDAFYEWAAQLPPPRITKPARTQQQPRVNYAAGGSVWDRIAACESGGNWAVNTGNSYYGGLQMNMQFWHSYGGDEYAERPDLATREQQIVVAERARDSGRGYSPWPVCGQRE